MKVISNKYYIIPTAIPNDIKEFLVSGGEKCRMNKNGTKAVVKRRYNDNEDRPQFNAFQEFTHEEILEELKKPEWIQDPNN